MAKFHPFNDLPKELRDSIWDMAIRKDEPAAHLFTMYDAKKDHDSVIDPTKKVHVTGDLELTSWPYLISFYTGLAAPRNLRNGRLSWTDGNTSTYLEDSGLWTACHESRERMLRHFKPSETSPQASRCRQSNQSTIWDIRAKPNASVNMEFTRDNGERQYLTIRPSTDLICLQVPKNSKLSFGPDDFDWRDTGEFPLFRWRGDDSYYSYCSDIKNVAVEYDPAWDESHNSYDHFPTVGGVFSFICDIPGLDAFWFIDYRLTRKFKREEGERRRRMFHAGRMTFIEVMKIDNEWCCCPKEGCSDECLSNRLKSTPHGAHRLADFCDSYHSHWLTDSDDDEPWYEGEYGVLACVDLELEGELPTTTEWFFDGINERLAGLGL